MVSTKGGKTRIRITEGGGQHPALLGGLVGAATIVGAALLSGTVIDAFWTIPAAGAILGTSYAVARSAFRRLITSRRKLLEQLMERISAHVTETGSKAR
jgi:hypothetical protein